MIPWLIFLTYLTGLVLSSWFFAKVILNGWDRDNTLALDDADRWGALILGTYIGLFWPVVVPVHALRHVAVRGLRTDREINEARDAELWALRALARKYNLPLPGEDEQ
jgi:hypothetical protein